MEDHELLRQFAGQQSETAFAELVRRHVDLVWSAARRQVSDPAIAEDVTQEVFVLLARRAATIRNGNALPAWLLVATRGVALNSLRSQSRRRRHEQEAAAMKPEAQTGSSSDWEQTRPMLDEAVGQLKPDDRDALTIRYFGNRTNEQVAAALGVSPQAAQKRISRAVERLRDFFARRGITTSSQALSAVLVQHAVGKAPAALSGRVASSALSGAKTVASVSTSTSKGAVAIMAMTNAKLAVTASVAAIVLMGVTVPIVYHARSSTVHVEGARATTAPSPEQWEAGFANHYVLAADQSVKRVKPPYISERENFFQSMRVSFMETPPTSYVILWDGTNLRWQSCVTNEQRNLASVLCEVGGIWPQDTDIPREMMSKEIAGDWVIRAGATTEQRVTGLAPEILSLGKTLKLEPMERDVIVATGQLEYHPRPATKTQDAFAKTIQIVLYRGSEEATNHAIAQTQTEMLQQLGKMIGYPVMNEAKLGEPRPVMFHSLGSLDDFMRAQDSTDRATVDDLLEIISEQTSLQFKRERRIVPTWKIVDG